MQGAMVEKAKRHRPFVADLAPHRSRLSESQVVRMTGRAAADKAGEGGNDLQMPCISHPSRRCEEQLRFVDCLFQSVNWFRVSLQSSNALLIELLEHVGI